MKRESRQQKHSIQSKGKTRLDRRCFLRLLAAAGGARIVGTLLEISLAPAPQQTQPAQSTQRVTKEMLHAAEQLIGIELNDAQETMALQGVNRALSGYETLRKIDIPLDTEPAPAF